MSKRKRYTSDGIPNTILSCSRVCGRVNHLKLDTQLLKRAQCCSLASSEPTKTESAVTQEVLTAKATVAVDYIAIFYYGIVAESITTIAHLCAITLGFVVWRIATLEQLTESSRLPHIDSIHCQAFFL